MPPTAHEQLMLELINRLRMDPDGEYARLTSAAFLAEIQGAINYFGVNLASFQAALLTYNPVAPLAWSTTLAQAALTHNQAMIAADTQSHQLPGEPGLGTRATNAGYTGWNALGENIYAYSDSVEYGHAGFVIDWGYDVEDFNGNTLYPDWQIRGDGIQDPAGHLNSLMNGTFREIGIAITQENNAATDVGPFVITQDFGSRFSYAAQFVGVVIDDADNDDFYDVGEGLGGVTVRLSGTAGIFTTTTWEAGGWQIAVPAGTYDISFSGGGLSGSISRSATLGTANVKLDVEAADAVVTGNTQNGTPDNDELTGTGAIDILNGLGGNDRLYGLGGDDRLDGGIGDDTLVGGQGNDTYLIDSIGDVVTELLGQGFDRVISTGNFTANVVRFRNVEAFELAGSATELVGNQLGNELVANAVLGSQLLGLGGADVLIGGAGNDILNGGIGNDTMQGGAGDDRYFVYETGDVIIELAGEGIDFVLSALNYTLGADVEDLRLAGAAATVGTGNALANRIFGGSAGATLSGLDGDDTIYGSNASDIIMGGNGADRLLGNSGADTIHGGEGDDVLNGGNSNDTLHGDGGNDLILGGSGNDVLYGGTGNDTLRGEASSDTLYGGAGADILDGDDGLDRLIGGADRDVMTGGLRADVFAFDDGDFAGLAINTADRITDFDRAQGDKIDLSAVDAIFGGEDDGFDYIGSVAFSGTAGELRWAHEGGNTMIYMDVNGDALADYAIRLDGTINLVEASFIL